MNFGCGNMPLDRVTTDLARMARTVLHRHTKPIASIHVAAVVCSHREPVRFQMSDPIVTAAAPRTRPYGHRFAFSCSKSQRRHESGDDQRSDNLSSARVE